MNTERSEKTESLPISQAPPPGQIEVRTEKLDSFILRGRGRASEEVPCRAVFQIVSSLVVVFETSWGISPQQSEHTATPVPMETKLGQEEWQPLKVICTKDSRDKELHHCGSPGPHKQDLHRSSGPGPYHMFLLCEC